MAEETKDQLEAQGLSVSLINPRFIKPLDADAISRLAKQAKVVCTFEDHVLINGFGASVIELLHDSDIDTHVVRIGWPDEFVEHGKVPTLRELHGLTAANAVTQVTQYLSTVEAVTC